MKKEIIAEVKPFKVGETLTSNVDGNPELSLIDTKESVETGRKVCIKCGKIITEKNRQKYCSDKCRNAFNAYKWCLKVDRFEKPGVGSGGNQLAENNHQFTGKSGVGGCKKAKKLLPNICNRCGTTEYLVAHHIDENRTNNDISNFEILCKKCHQIHHTSDRRDSITGKYIKGQSTP
jgi:hypothetical protein